MIQQAIDLDINPSDETISEDLKQTMQRAGDKDQPDTLFLAEAPWSPPKEASRSCRNTGIHHVGLRATNPAASAEFYKDVLGMEIIGGSAPDHPIGATAFLTSRPGEESHEIALFANPAFAHVAFKVSSLAELRSFYARVVERNIPIKFLANHGVSFAFYFDDPDGNMIEVYWPTGELSRNLQPQLEPLDLSQPDEMLLEKTPATRAQAVAAAGGANGTATVSGRNPEEVMKSATLVLNRANRQISMAFITILLLVGFCFGQREVSPHPQSVTAAAELNSRSNELNSGPPNELGLLWKHHLGQPVQSSPAAAGIFCRIPDCVDRIFIGDNDGNLYALNATNGDVVWHHAVGYILSRPAVARLSFCSEDCHSAVYVGSTDENVYAFNAETGAELWHYTTGGMVNSSPAVANGVVYVGSDDHNVYALNALTGAKLWSYTTAYLVTSSPAVVNEVVYVGSWDNNVYALNALTGAKLWSYTTGDKVLSSPAVSHGRVYVGSLDNSLYALDAATGAKLWSFATGDRIRSSPAVASGLVYFGSEDHNFYALEAATGAQRWRYTTGGAIDGLPAVGGVAVYFGSFDNNLYGLQRFHGELLTKNSFDNPVEDWPVVGKAEREGLPGFYRNTVFLGHPDGNVYSFDAICCG